MKKLLLIILIVCTSCLGSKKVSEKTSLLKETTSIKNDSVSKQTVNKGINDEATFKVAESNTGDVDFDKRVNEAVSNVLRSINFQKSSGDNSYKFYYDEQLRELRAKVELGETRNSEVATNKDAVVEKEESTTESFKKVVTTLPWWVWVIAFVVFFKQIMGIIGNVYPPARGINSIAELFNPPKRE